MKQTVIDWMHIIQGGAGVVLGFLFTVPIKNAIVDFMTKQGEVVPGQIPLLTHFLAAGGTVGIIILLIGVILGLKLLSKLITFVIWLIIGMLLALLISIFGIDPLGIIRGLIGV